MKITMIAIGSTGDVRPYVLLGKELARRGHQITIAAFASFQQMVEKEGLSFFPLPGDVMTLMGNIMKPGTTGFTFLAQLEKSLRSIAEPFLEEILRSCQDADAMVCTFFGSTFYSVAEKYHIPCVQTHYFPMDINDLTPISSAPGQRIGKLWNRASYRLGYLLISMLERAYLNPWREKNGMCVSRRLRTSPDYTVDGQTVPVIYAISQLLMPRPPQWGAHIHMSGFWWEGDPEPFTPPQDLVDFLKAGPPPVYIGFGSMVSGNMTKTFTRVIRAVRASGIRAVVSMGWAEESLQVKSNSRIYFGKYLPHDWLFPQMAAVVHHGGAGTCASGLRAGKPTLVIPFGGDQPFWGDRVYRLGCGPKPIPRDMMTVRSLTKALIDLTSRDKYRTAAEELSAALRMERGVLRAADIIENTITNWNRAD